ncbi:unnamed protein product [Echinostoma caproni]|uniref:Uncharacterized protein n=1 Tax=Echinostoma caproni TaxID=27848 RepID=A0A183B1R7_9TREM|nr:unnamed protein product [Echinostoma caproni]
MTKSCALHVKDSEPRVSSLGERKPMLLGQESGDEENTDGHSKMELPTIEQLKLYASPYEIELFNLWFSVYKGGKQDQVALLFTTGSRELYSIPKNLAFPEATVA